MKKMFQLFFAIVLSTVFVNDGPVYENQIVLAFVNETQLGSSSQGMLTSCCKSALMCSIEGFIA